jgi:hypothetical protein
MTTNATKWGQDRHLVLDASGGPCVHVQASAQWCYCQCCARILCILLLAVRQAPARQRLLEHNSSCSFHAL